MRFRWQLPDFAMIHRPDFRRLFFADALVSVGSGATTIALMVLISKWKGPQVFQSSSCVKPFQG